MTLVVELGDDVGDGWVNQLCFSPDGRYLAAGTSYLGGTVDLHPPCHLTVRDLAAGRNRFRIDVGEHYLRGLAYRPDGRQVATAGYGGVKFARKWNGAVKYWSAETGAAEAAMVRTLRLELTGTGVRVMEIAPGMVATEEFALNRFGGDAERARAVYDGITPLVAEDIADAIAWMVERPHHVNVDLMVVRPREQGSATKTVRSL